ncbi:MAG TPA: ATP-dependent DNA ligase, partial [Thermodesulfobacteriota bacterium]|nr:ATP-dependent DNA ligase [Thermodesulfobacteriota bacterium]
LGAFAGDVLVEDKLDGVRATAHVGPPPPGGGPAAVRLFSRRLEDVTARFPELVAALARLPGPLVLDGEIVAWREGRPLPFGLLQRRLGRRSVSPALLTEVPTALVLFDCLLAGDASLLDLPLEARRARLAALPLAPPLFLSPAERIAARAEGAADRLAQRVEEAWARGYEGLMLKDPASPYRPGTRGRHWLKLKQARATLDVVVVAVEYGHGKRAGVLSDYTFAVRDGERLLTIGKAYSGLTDAELARLTRHFLATTVEDRGALRVVEPTVVLEVAFDAIQRSDRHASGYALRFPRIVRIRDDKGVAEIDTLEHVEALYRRQAAAPAGAGG